MTLETILRDAVYERKQLQVLLGEATLDGSVRKLLKKKMRYLSKIGTEAVNSLTNAGFSAEHISRIVDSGVRGQNEVIRG